MNWIGIRLDEQDEKHVRRTRWIAGRMSSMGSREDEMDG